MATTDYAVAAGVLITLQAGALTWRIQREREMESDGEPTWFPVADWLNVLGLAALVLGVFVLPVVGLPEAWTARLVGVDGMLVLAFPFALAGHYEILLSPRHEGKPRSYCPPQEMFVAIAAAVGLVAYGIGIAIRGV